jgi:hypothetical protein
MESETQPPGNDLPAFEPTEGGERFYQGIIAKISWGHETGIVRSGNGREIPLVFPFVTVVGGRRPIETLREGMAVGFDVGWTSRGLRVTVLKIYE